MAKHEFPLELRFKHRAASVAEQQTEVRRHEGWESFLAHVTEATGKSGDEAREVAEELLAGREVSAGGGVLLVAGR